MPITTPGSSISRTRIASGVQALEIAYPFDHRESQLTTIELSAPIQGTTISLETSAP
jgi:hypothetical protein